MVAASRRPGQYDDVRMDQSPIDQLLEALDRRDVSAATSLLAPDCELLLADGRRANGRQGVVAVLEEFMAMTRSMSHQTTAQWQVADGWIAEVSATYELQDWLLLPDLPRAFVLRTGPEGIASMHIYGGRERPLADHRTGEEGMRISDRWIPPL